MKIQILNGSGRKDSNSLKLSLYINQILKNKNIDSEVLDFSETEMSVYNTNNSENEFITKAIEKVNNADGFVFVSPEWDGMFSISILNFLYYIEYEMADKPIFLVAVSASRGGRYPLLQARIMGYKNKRLVFTPESFYIDDFNANFKKGTIINAYLNDRLNYDLDVFLEYVKALQNVRKSGIINYGKYENGM